MHDEAQNNPQSEDNIKNLKKLSEVRELRIKEVLMAWLTLLQQSLKESLDNTKKEGI